MKLIKTDNNAAAVIGREIFPVESSQDLAKFAAGEGDGWINGVKMSQDESPTDYGDLVAVYNNGLKIKDKPGWIEIVKDFIYPANPKEKVILLHYALEKSVADIARNTGVSYNTAWRWIHRDPAPSRLAEMMIEVYMKGVLQ